MALKGEETDVAAESENLSVKTLSTVVSWLRSLVDYVPLTN